VNAFEIHARHRLLCAGRASANRGAAADDSGSAELRRHKAFRVSDEVLLVAAQQDLHASGDDDTRNQIHAEIAVHDEEQVDQFAGDQCVVVVNVDSLAAAGRAA
jgi:hypothetical protein